MTQAPTIPYTDTLRITICPTCLQPHAVSRLLYLAAEEGGTAICCPAGHTYIPTKPENCSNALQHNIELTAAIADAEARLAAVSSRAADVPPAPAPTPPDHLELVRRARLMQSIARRSSDGKLICRFCGKKLEHKRGIVRHLFRCHISQLTALPSNFGLENS